MKERLDADATPTRARRQDSSGRGGDPALTGANLQLATIELADPDGRPARLGDLDSEFLVVQLVRYFGCLPCQEWLVALNEARPVLADAGASPVAVGGSADYQARWLRDRRGVDMPLLLDPSRRIASLVGVGNLGRGLLDPRGAVSYGRSLAHGFRPQRPTRDTVRAPGVVILDRGRHIRWVHVGRRIGDYPPLSRVLAALSELGKRA